MCGKFSKDEIRKIAFGLPVPGFSIYLYTDLWNVITFLGYMTIVFVSH